MKSIMDYDTAMVEREKRISFLNMLKYLRSSRISICEWSLVRCIKNTNERCDVLYTDYISDICKNLIVSGINRISKKINIINDSIENLHISLNCDKQYLNNIIGKNIRNITLVYVNSINLDVFKNINENCPKLEKLTYITRIAFDNRDIINQIVDTLNTISKHINTKITLFQRF